ncbi:MAG TPA: WYL domain-containing protein [Paucimonas sp.]|nr:WYL domain-containing protein [Paucimonas sp.]
MATRSSTSRLHRLEQLKGLLSASDFTTAALLADELGVSRRTLNRDLAILKDHGVPIEADRGRGGGLRLQRNWHFGRLHLSPEEAIDLLLSLVIAERMNQPFFMQHLDAIRRKVATSFAPAQQGRIRSLRKRILIGTPASGAMLASFPPPRAASHGDIARAFLEQQCIVIDYVDGNGARSTRTVEPQFLYFSSPIWFLLTWDRLRNAIRSFRADRITAVRTTDIPFRLQPPGPFVEQAERGAGFL